MSQKVRLVGGIKHGEFMAVREGARDISIPVYDRVPAYAFSGYAAFDPPFHEVRYERREVNFDGMCKAFVFTPRGMDAGEFYRRLADLIEGTAVPERDRMSR